MPRDPLDRPSVAIVGTGISGMAAAWLLAPHFDVTVMEADSRMGGHSNTVSVPVAGEDIAVDTGFIVYNEATYPNLTALFEHLNVKTNATNMSFAASLRGGSMEYSGESLRGLIAQKSNLLRPRFWSMLYDLQRFYRLAPEAIGQGADLPGKDTHNALHRMTLGDFLEHHRFGPAFVDDHLLPLSAAIWSAKPGDILDYPIEAFVRFHDNHGLLNFVNRPIWRTVEGGSRSYVKKLTAGYAGSISLNTQLASIRRREDRVELVDNSGQRMCFDHVILATHADQALALLGDPGDVEHELLSAIRYSQNEAWLHSDPALMPNRKSAWASWNFLEEPGNSGELVVTYWMNKLQNLNTDRDMFVTLNPARPPREDYCYRVETYEHPVIDFAALNAQKRLWSLQGKKRTWFCGAYFGAGFHEDGLQSGLAAAEALAAAIGYPHIRRPWKVADESGRIHVSTPAAVQGERLLA